LRAYQIGAASGRKPIIVSTTDTAWEALEKYLLALDEFDRAWVTDCSGADVSLAELIARSEEEKNKP
jgi:hypothetical protein